MDELEHRLVVWGQLPGDLPVKRTEPSKLRELGVYGGAQGVWVDKNRTAHRRSSPTTCEWCLTCGSAMEARR